MKNFQCLGTGVDVAPLLNAVLRNDLWNKNLLRTTHPDSPHKQVDDIWLRFNVIPSDNPFGTDHAYEKFLGKPIEHDLSSVTDDKESINYPAWFALPEAQNIALNLMRQVRGERLGRVLITRLSPGKTISPHVDGGAPAEYYSRYHVSLQGLPGQMFHCGDETVVIRTGEVWWFNNLQTHAIENNSTDDRITLIIDVRTPR